MVFFLLIWFGNPQINANCISSTIIVCRVVSQNRSIACVCWISGWKQNKSTWIAHGLRYCFTNHLHMIDKSNNCGTIGVFARVFERERIHWVDPGWDQLTYDLSPSATPQGYCLPRTRFPLTSIMVLLPTTAKGKRSCSEEGGDTTVA